MHACPHRAFLFQGPLLLSFQEDPLQPPLELAVQQVWSVARSAQEKVSRGRSHLRWAFPYRGSEFKAAMRQFILS